MAPREERRHQSLAGFRLHPAGGQGVLKNLFDSLPGLFGAHCRGLCTSSLPRNRQPIINARTKVPGTIKPSGAEIHENPTATASNAAVKIKPGACEEIRRRTATATAAVPAGNFTVAGLPSRRAAIGLGLFRRPGGIPADLAAGQGLVDGRSPALSSGFQGASW